MFRVTLLFISTSIPPIICSCFTQSPWTNIRPLIRMIDPCSAISDCESACLASTECVAYAFVNSKCALLGPDSGKAQICKSVNPTCYVRTAACDATTSTTSTTTTGATSTTTTSASTTTTTTTPSTTTTSAAGCVALSYAPPATRTPGVLSPKFNATSVYCTPGYTLYETATMQMIGELSCVGGEWLTGAGAVVAGGSQAYCKPDATTTTTTTATTTSTCTPQLYDAPAICGGCLSPERLTDRTYCGSGYDLFLYDAQAVPDTQMVGELTCTDGKWLTAGGRIDHVLQTAACNDHNHSGLIEVLADEMLFWKQNPSQHASEQN